MDLDQWRRESSREHLKLFQRYAGRNWRTRVLLGWKQSGSCQCYHCKRVREANSPMSELLRFIETKGGFDLVVSDLPRDLGHVFVERSTHVLVVAEDERPLNFEAAGNDILCILTRELAGLFWF
jgi:hypothetical protein